MVMFFSCERIKPICQKINHYNSKIWKWLTQMHSLCWVPRCFFLSGRGWGRHGRQTAASSALRPRTLLPKRIEVDYGLIVFVRLPKRIEVGLIVFVLLPKRIERYYGLIVFVLLPKRIVGRLFVFLLKIYRDSYSTYMDLLLDWSGLFQVLYSILLRMRPLRFRWIEPRTVATLALAVRCSNHSAKSQSHPLLDSMIGMRWTQRWR